MRRNLEVDKQYYETEVNSISYDLSEVFDHRLLFDALPEGNYTYSIYAADNKGFSDEVIRSVFSVVSTMSSSITITGESYPTGSLEPGKPFGIYGKITSTYPLTRVWGGVYYLDGTPTAQYCDKNPNWTTFDLLKQFDEEIIFNDLTEGNYIYKIEAIDSKGYTATLVESSFSIGEAPLPDIILSGDADNDKVLSVLDVMMVQKWILQVDNSTLTNTEAADMDHDGIVDIYDLALLKRSLLKAERIA